MKKKFWLSCLLCCAGLLALVLPARGGLLALETPLSNPGRAYEVNLDSQGKLWVSEADTGKIWAFDSLNGAYKVYLVGGGPSDAHSDGNGSVWWADFTSNHLSRVLTSTHEVKYWAIPNSLGLYSTALGSGGTIWASDYYASKIYNLNPDPESNLLCVYTIPNNGLSEYLEADGARLWFGDYINARLVLIEGTRLTWWSLQEYGYPRDLEVDENGAVWWTDANLRKLGHLAPGEASFTAYSLPFSGIPIMMKLREGKAWFTLQSPSGLATMDPSIEQGELVSTTSEGQDIFPDCDPLLPTPAPDVMPTDGQAEWNGQSYPQKLSQPGWTVFQMPENGLPWGITATHEIWLVDQGRHSLTKVSPASQLYFPLVVK